jgi:hypothetical protein
MEKIKSGTRCEVKEEIEDFVSGERCEMKERIKVGCRKCVLGTMLEVLS